MSGTGKSTALQALSRRGHQVVDADSSQWSQWAEAPDGSVDWMWRPDEMARLLTSHQRGKLFVAGTAQNQKEFYPLFDHVALLSAPAEIMLDRIASRTGNDFGKTAEEREKILRDLAEVEPLLRNSATLEIDTSIPLDEVVRQLDELALSAAGAVLGRAVPLATASRHEVVPRLRSVPLFRGRDDRRQLAGGWMVKQFDQIELTAEFKANPGADLYRDQ